MGEFFLNTTRLKFSIWGDQDITSALELWGNPETTKFIIADGKMSEHQIKERLNKEIATYEKNGIQYWPVYLKETNDFIGCCGLRPYDPENIILEMGIHLNDKFWRKGYAYEACSAIIDYAFKNFKVNGIFAGHNPKNVASSKLLTKLGFKYMKDEFYPPTGLYHPSYMITKEDYKL